MMSDDGHMTVQSDFLVTYAIVGPVIVALFLFALLMFTGSPSRPTSSRVEPGKHAAPSGQVRVARPTPCALCGYPLIGSFDTPVPFHPGAWMHTMSCGPSLNGVEKVAEPTHRQLGDGSVEKIGAT